MALTRSEKKKEKRRKSGTYKFLKTTGLILVTLMVLIGGAFGYFVMKAADVTTSAQTSLERGDRSEKRLVPVNPSKDNISVLFLGLDDRDGGLKGRTDALLLATFNKKENSVKMVSVPRDARVELIGRDRMDKINHAHAFGGVDMTIATVENLLDLPVDYFVKLNFDAFMEIIDALGGIEVEVPFAFTEMDSNDVQGAISIKEGLQLLDGEEALAYSRMRKKDPRGDIGRGERQQQVLEGIIKKGSSLSSINKFDDVMKSIENNLATNLSFGNILSLHSYSSGLRNIERLTIEGKNASIKGIYYYELIPESVKEISTTLREHLEVTN
ncbi:LytR family transcriptional regulator [Anaerobacillus alkaliphilus]|uniref:LytR family transcriptional regulator n=1 Tax=Anaerobacillus alkaliphilus TaxID=1548597 RepID=A0A4Q0VXC7_9BACI|nr:LCP family protein [Anaerobacillus alkaliphilus]RXJ02295.1 LytR family transcriptional regulator [Anaerobacillus alkaliphilus]